MFISKDKERTYQLARFGMSVGIAAAMLLAVYFRAGIYFEIMTTEILQKY